MSEVGQRQPRVECAAFLAFVRRKPCCACGAPAPSQAAHIRMSSIAAGKRSTGKGEKPSDRWAVPLCGSCHLDGPEAQHKVGEQRFWRRVGIDPCFLAATLYAQFERRQARSPEQRERVVRRAVRRKERLVTGISLRGRLSKLTTPRPIKSASRWPKGRKIPTRRMP